MSEIVTTLMEWGIYGLVIASFTEAFISPILPDIIMLPLMLAKPQDALYLGAITTLASVLGGFVGYGVGYKIGAPAARKMIPGKYLDKIEGYLRDNAKWAIFLAAVAPIPYKFVSISAGAFRVNFVVFILISIVARSKRFLLPGAVVYFFGPSAQELISQYSNDAMVASLILILIAGFVYYLYRRRKRKELPGVE